MNISFRIVGVVALVAIIGVGLFVASQFRSRLTSPTDQLTVGASIFPLADIVSQIGGDYVRVVLLIPVGSSEHSMDLKPQTLAEIEHAKALFAVGHGLDDKVVSRVQNAYHLPVTVVDKGVVFRDFSLSTAHDLSEGEHDEEDEGHDTGVDPHYWLALPNGIRIARTVADELIRIDPEHAAAYEQNYVQYAQELQNAEKELQARAQKISQRHFISMHNAWGYFAQNYGLQLVATYEPVEGHEPSLSQLKEIGEVISRYGIKAFYAEPQKASTAAVSFLKDQFGLKILTLDPVGGTRNTSSYIETIEHNLAAIEAGQ